MRDLFSLQKCASALHILPSETDSMVGCTQVLSGSCLLPPFLPPSSTTYVCKAKHGEGNSLPYDFPHDMKEGPFYVCEWMMRGIQNENFSEEFQVSRSGFQAIIFHSRNGFQEWPEVA